MHIFLDVMVLWLLGREYKIARIISFSSLYLGMALIVNLTFYFYWKFPEDEAILPRSSYSANPVKGGGSHSYRWGHWNLNSTHQLVLSLSFSLCSSPSHSWSPDSFYTALWITELQNYRITEWLGLEVLRGMWMTMQSWLAV